MYRVNARASVPFFQSLEKIALIFPIIGKLCAGAVFGEGPDIVAFQPEGILHFNEATNAAAYHVTWAANLEITAWSNALPELPATGTGTRAVTVSVNQAAGFYRVDARFDPLPLEGMVMIPAGVFVMGATTNVPQEGFVNELPQHTVTLSAFYIATNELAKVEWDATALWGADHGYTLSPGLAPAQASNHPVHSVTWENAIKWCNAKSEQCYRTPCYTNQDGSVYRSNSFNGGCNWSANGYRLPTEAEWEKAARGGEANHRFSWTDDENIQHDRANYYSDAAFSYDNSPTRAYHPIYHFLGYPGTAPGGAFAPNGYGLSEMVGNVYEWCWDFYASDYYASSPGEDPHGPANGTARMYRGGGWNSYARECRVAWRASRPADEGNYDLGIRLVVGAP